MRCARSSQVELIEIGEPTNLRGSALPSRACATLWPSVHESVSRLLSFSIRGEPATLDATKKRSAGAQGATDRLGRVVGTLIDQHGGTLLVPKGRKPNSNYPLHTRPAHDLIFLKLRAFAHAARLPVRAYIKPGESGAPRAPLDSRPGCRVSSWRCARPGPPPRRAWPAANHPTNRAG